MRRETECSMQKSDFELAPGFEWCDGEASDFIVKAGERFDCMTDPLLRKLGLIYFHPGAFGSADPDCSLRTAADVRAWYAAHPDVTCPFVWGE